MNQALYLTLRLAVAGSIVWLNLSKHAAAEPALFSPELGRLELVTPSLESQQLLVRIDGLAFDVYGNLFGALEITGESGGVAYIDKTTGDVTVLTTGISRADQIEFAPSGKLFVTSEIYPGSSINRLWQVTIDYDALDEPVAASKSSLQTSLPISGPEGLVILEAAGPYGSVGDLLVAEDLPGGRILRVSTDGTTVQLSMNLQRPEGMAFGDFADAEVPALYVAETANHRVLRINSDGTIHSVGNPGPVSLIAPDNLEFGSDGYLYVSEDRPGPLSRILRVKQGVYEVFATGFAQAQGMVFDTNGDLYIAEQNLNRVWRVVFDNPLPGDYNRNGTVDATDYVMWRNSLGEMGTRLAADGDGNHKIDAGDYDLWRANFGRLASSGSHVDSDGGVILPEPQAIVIPFTGVLAIRLRRRF